jgi:hypothetical protein
MNMNPDDEAVERVIDTSITQQLSGLAAKDEKQSLRQFIRDEFRKVHDRLNKIERDIG